MDARKVAVMAVALLGFATTSVADEIGIVKVVSGTVHIERQGQRVPAAVGARVDRADRIVTGKDGSIGLSFADSSIVSAGPNSVVDLDQFRYDPTSREGNFDISLKRGTLSAISGKLVEQKPGAMQVRTPTAVLAVRGTEFAVHVDPPAE